MTAMAHMKKKLDKLQAEIDAIKKQVADADLIVTNDDLQAMAEAEEGFRLGKTRSV
jgi:hypothetical protein